MTASTIRREVLGINNRVELAEVDRLFRERKARELMLAGVTIEKPETVTIDARCAHRHGYDGRAVRADSGQHARSARTAASAPARSCRIPSSADEVEIGAFTMVGHVSRWTRGAHAGPFARLRMDNHVEGGAHIGNFVELKKDAHGRGR